VLDASALLAALNDEPGSDAVARALPNAAISAVNLSEVATILLRLEMAAEVARSLLDDLDLEVVPFSRDMAYGAAVLGRRARFAGLSLADRACLALAAARRLPALTADPAWRSLDVGVEVRLIR
jgi:ribonuclease VapC